MKAPELEADLGAGAFLDRFELDGDRAARGIGYFDTHPIREALTAAASQP